MKDPYQTLGVPKSASEADIKKAFRALAKAHHPDTHQGDPGAQKRFQEISAAYDILGDKDKRAQFDAGAIGADGNPRNPFGGGFDPRQAGGYGGGNPFGGGARDFEFHFDQGGGGGFETIFENLMGGRRPGGRGRARAQKGEDFTAAVTVSFDEPIAGGTRRVTLPNGEQIDVKIPAGVKDGQTIRVKGRGGAGLGGGPNGDVLLTISVAAHPFMTRDGNDIRMDLPVTLKEAVLGDKVPVPTLTGTVSLRIPPNSNTGTVLRLKGKGVAGAGDLYVRLVVSLPDKADPELTRFLEGWSGIYDPRARMH